MVPNIAGSDPGGARQSKLVEKPVDVPFLPAAKAIYDQRNSVLSKDDPESRCLPPGVPRMMATPFPFQIFQLSDRIVFIFEGGAHVWRTIPMDGRNIRQTRTPLSWATRSATGKETHWWSMS